jgi:calcineurin-like phosphoesterase family protein
MRWFTSDEHFGHSNIIKFCNRPFKDTSHMRETLINNHNEVVKPGDLVYHLGDMFWHNLTDEECIAILMRLNGQHFYIYGNHEKQTLRCKALINAFVWTKDVENLHVDGLPNIWLAHYAHRVWNGSHRGAYHLYGHTHNAMPEDSSLSFDVGVDAQNFYPVSLDAIVEKMKKKAGLFQFKNCTCINKECGSSFKAIDANPENKICAKCCSRMELI